MQGTDGQWNPQAMFNITIPREPQPLQVSLVAGDVLFMLGANGTGKSGLVQRVYMEHASTASRISAHRQSWFQSGRLDLTSQAKREVEQNIRNTDVRPESRWRDDYGPTRSSIAIYNIIQQRNNQNRDIASAVRSGDTGQAAALAQDHQDPIETLNRLLAQAGLQITISVRDDEELTATRTGSTPYSIAELSDGERNVLLLAAEVLTAPAKTLILIDEPERHLHRSIISPLLTELFAERPDCTFVLSTHDVGLALDKPAAKVLLVRSCHYDGQSAQYWDADYVESLTTDVIGDDLKRDIFGARRVVLFVEGSETSLDQPLYSLVLPGVSVIGKGNCREVEHAVKSLREADSLHWVHAFGVVDNDGRDPHDTERLRANGIYPIDTYTVESIYYDPSLQALVAKRLASVDGSDADKKIERARDAAIDAIGDSVAEDLAKRAAQRRLRAEHLSHLPKRQDISFDAQVCISLDAPAILAEEVERVSRAVADRDVATLIRRYPIKNTAVLPRIAQALGFPDRRAYEQAVLKLLADDEEARQMVRQLLGGLHDAITVTQHAPQGDGGW